MKLSRKGQGRGGCLGVRKKERFVLGKRTFRSQKSKHFVLRIIYYAQLIFGFSPLVGHYNIFYRKSDDKSFFFRETTEGVMLKTVYFCDDFLLSLASYEDMEAYKHVLDEQEFAKLKGRTEEDNPFLVKCYFK